MHRIIPARAGFTARPPRPQNHRRDHPRSRGVYDLGALKLSARPWIIPARAGFTRLPPAHGLAQADHPRSRGVYDELASAIGCSGGSSPLARGLQVGQVGGADRLGIIPARAGFTRRRAGRRPRRRDHPRSRGVYSVTAFFTSGDSGSSPLARGLHLQIHGRVVIHGIIPARAGFTHRGHGRRGRDRDHPRSRGVYVAVADATVVAKGSSPLARGLPLRTAPRAPS